jgi:hypothetical protein
MSPRVKEIIKDTLFENSIFYSHPREKQSRVLKALIGFLTSLEKSNLLDKIRLTWFAEIGTVQFKSTRP